MNFFNHIINVVRRAAFDSALSHALKEIKHD